MTATINITAEHSAELVALAKGYADRVREISSVQPGVLPATIPALTAALSAQLLLSGLFNGEQEHDFQTVRGFGQGVGTVFGVIPEPGGRMAVAAHFTLNIHQAMSTTGVIHDTQGSA